MLVFAKQDLYIAILGGKMARLAALVLPGAGIDYANQEGLHAVN